MTEKDINTAFDDILLTEERIIEESYEIGYKEGENQGNPEAYHLGYHRGAEIGAELGYYLGIISNLSLSNPSEKVSRVLENLQSEIANFPRENSEDDYLSTLDNIRANYKKLCALLKLDAFWGEADKLSF